MRKIRSIAVLVLALVFGAMIMAGQDRNARSISGTRSPVLARHGMVADKGKLAYGVVPSCRW